VRCPHAGAGQRLLGTDVVIAFGGTAAILN